MSNQPDTAPLKTVRRCGHWLDGQHCDIADNTVRLYLVGHRCAQHTPSAVVGQTESTPDPELTITGLRGPDSRRLHDVVIDMPGVGRVVLQ